AFSSSSPRCPRHPPAFPTRRSSDLARTGVLTGDTIASVAIGSPPLPKALARKAAGGGDHPAARDAQILVEQIFQIGFEHFEVLRSEEHTSELQSRENLVCRLLLEKK